MGPPKSPVKITKDNVADILGSFDAIVLDCDGVIWSPLKDIKNAGKGLNSLKEAGKSLYFASNNSVQRIIQKFDRLGLVFPVQENEVVHPALALSHHLRQIGFKKKAYVLAGEQFKECIRDAGVTVLPEERNERVPEDLRAVLNCIQDDPEIGAVVVDFDVNASYIEMMRALHHLRRPDCLFFVGATDFRIPIGDKLIIGPVFIFRAFEEALGRKATALGKPSPMMIDYLRSVHSLDLKRTLFVGDTLEQDMGVARACDMQSLLVLTGVTAPGDLDGCDPDLVPDYYIDGVADFATLLRRD